MHGSSKYGAAKDALAAASKKAIVGLFSHYRADVPPHKPSQQERNHKIRQPKSGTLRALQQLAFDSMEIPFNDRGVSVTRNALSSAGQVFPLRDIVDVQVVTVPKNKVLPITISVLGLAGAIAGGVFRAPVGLVCGAMLVVVGWLTWATQDVTHRLMVQTSTGEREALSSVDREFVERVSAAVNEAKSGTAPSASAAPAQKA